MSVTTKNIVYDFDGTLTQNAYAKYLVFEEYGYPNGTLNKNFIDKVFEKKLSQNIESALAFYQVCFEIFNSCDKKIDDERFIRGIDKIKYSKGIPEYFENLNLYVTEKNVMLKQYIISSGSKMYLEHIPFAKYFTYIYGTEFSYDNDMNIAGLGNYVGNKEKIEALKKINVENNRADFDCRNLVYIGDGFTDYDALKFTHENGGFTIFVHQENDSLDAYKQLNKEHIIDECVLADYSSDSKLYCKIKEILLT